MVNVQTYKTLMYNHLHALGSALGVCWPRCSGTLSLATLLLPLSPFQELLLFLLFLLNLFDHILELGATWVHGIAETLPGFSQQPIPLSLFVLLLYPGLPFLTTPGSHHLWHLGHVCSDQFLSEGQTRKGQVNMERTSE